MKQVYCQAEYISTPGTTAAEYIHCRHQPSDLAVLPALCSLLTIAIWISLCHCRVYHLDTSLLLQPHRAPVADMAIDASGGYLASGSADRAIKVTDLAGGFVTHHFTGHG
jgi:WD40 repeat protein